jgi:uncharacterized protein YjbI with pentapeptide repeats
VADKKNQLQIKSRWTGEVLYAYETDAEVTGVEYGVQLGNAICEAVAKRADLQGADLQGAYLRGAYLQGAYLRGADLRGADLRGAYLQGAYLRGAYLRGADLQGAYLRGAYLRGADLRGADLQGAYLRGAYLQGAYLRGADLRGADLRGADLQGADLQGAYLRGAYLQGAYLRGADLRGADLRGADLQGADLQGADLQGAAGRHLAIAMTCILPEGDLIGWKKCSGQVIVKLRIPADAKRSHAFGRKCRAEFADVLEVIGSEVGISLHDGKTQYVAGQRVVPDAFDPEWTNECASGVHFFITRAEAEAY